VATEARARNAFEQWQVRKGERTLAFCVSQRHADFMKQFFETEGVRAAAVHSGPASDPRERSLAALRDGEIDVLFAVDMFNEGLDVPEIDTVLMLRPTESRIIWLQQFGRGLRRADGKPFVTVIDYIGNHRVFLMKPRALLGASADAEVRDALERVASLTFGLPPGCEVTYDLEALDILKQLTGGHRNPVEALSDYFAEFVEIHGVRPRAVQAFHDGFNPRAARRQFGSWLGFVKSQGGLSGEGVAAFEAAQEFFEHLEKTPMEKSYKMLVLLAMLASDAFPGNMSVEDLVAGFAAAVGRSAELRADVPMLNDPVALRRMILENPVKAWTGGLGTGGIKYFEFEGNVFRTSRRLDSLRDKLVAATLVREIVEWRLADYLDRAKQESRRAATTASSSRESVCKVIHANGRPILMLDRPRNPGLPEGWAEILVGDERFQANFVKIALNVVRRSAGTPNVLPEILRGFFGEHAGMPGTLHFVVFERDVTGLRMRPRVDSEPAARIAPE